MPVSDPIGDFLTRIRNANKSAHDSLELPSSTILVEIARILTEEGYVKSYEVTQAAPQNKLKVTLKYGVRNREKVITDLRRISKPGLRVYSGRDTLPRVLRGLGVAIISTSQGVMTERQARRLGLGGEVLAYVW